MSFQKGNKFGRGRPKISLDKPELLLPVILKKGKVNWANDFVALYKAQKHRPLSLQEATTLKLYLELMPYLCTKVNVKELDFSKWTSPEEKQHMKNQTADLLKALEEINANPKPASGNKETGLGTGSSSVPPTV